ncbi:zinc finger Ran-binding domain-containing protein 2-like [Heracleum sosnowskyi]|uniref:Zinc finger Ran-binding domain-containing protein 2-like n=1 Tax=Heracleum sosnowskyi TaxID=360622 RepID=A0AAD8IWI7_9APIA|nr:zinc finger Ran-binding domain-containing protein 2-like [Heracleum sosnowskyi]
MQKSGDWMCGSCQYLNFKRWDSCQRCRFPKVGGEPCHMPSYGMNRTEGLPGDWYCHEIRCGAHNYASRASCYRCGVPKEDYSGHGAGIMESGGYEYSNTVPPGWKAGDWVCNRVGCGIHNYASRTECYKCKTPREYGGAV